jgi:hypothetical protein
MSKGFAIAGSDGIIIKTVSETEHGAMVNWLYTDAGLNVTNAWSNDRIRDAFDTLKRNYGVRVASISITEE